MTYVEEMWVLSHFDYYTYDKENGYLPTDKATPEAREALKKINEYNLRRHGSL